MSDDPLRDLTDKASRQPAVHAASARARQLTPSAVSAERDATRDLRLGLAIGRIGGWTWDLRQNDGMWDQSLLALIGYPADAPRRCNSRELLEIVLPDDRPKVVAALDRLLRLDAEYAVEYRYIHADGNTRWMFARAEVTEVEDGLPTRVTGICIDMTQRKQAEARLQRVVRTLKAARVATFFWDSLACTVSWEDEATITFPGVSGVVFDTDIEFVLSRVHAVDRERAREALEGALAYGGTVRVTCLAEQAQLANARWFEMVVVGSDDATDGSETLAGAFVDVTEHKLLEQQLLNARYELKLALLAGEIGTLTWDMRSMTATSDGVWDTIYGCGANELMAVGSEAFYSNVDARHRALVRDATALATTTGMPGKWTYRYQRPNGTWVWITVRSITECDATGSPWRMILAAVDVTELRRAEDRLRTQAEISHWLAQNLSFEDAVKSTLELVCQCEELDAGVLWSSDGDERILSCRALWLSAKLYTPDIDVAIRSYVYPSGVAFAGRALVASTRQHGAARDPLEELSMQFGLVEQIALPVLVDNECVGFVMFLGRKASTHDRDFDNFMSFVCVQLGLFVHRKSAEAELIRLNSELEARVRARTAELEASNKELESFSYSVSHDLRSPLRAVDGFSQALAAEFADVLPDEGKRLVGAIREGALRMGELIDDLLNFSRLSRAAIRKRSFDTQDLVRECLELLASMQVGRNVSLSVGALPASEGDRSLLKQVWVNLLSNALKYTGKCEQALIVVDSLPVDGLITYRVRDNGAGFDMRYAHKLFGVFKRLHRAEDYEGTGVGLAIVQRIVQRHGGRIWAEAKPNAGATFYFTLGMPAEPALLALDSSP